jgi:hypothetical protein
VRNGEGSPGYLGCARRAAAGGLTPYAIAVAFFAAFVVGGILGKAVPYGWSL